MTDQCKHGIPEGSECDLCYLGEDHTKDRIRLAEAMGWKPVARDADHWQGWFIVDDNDTWKKFDPFTSADDDYQVLEWMRDNPDHLLRSEFSAAIVSIRGQRLALWDYQIGNNARAALKVI